MAYNNVFPIGYQPMYYPQQFQQVQQNPSQVQQNAPQVQNGGFVAVKNEDEARNYLVAQGTSVTFRDESAPYIYTKTMGFSQLDTPVFEKFRLVKENADTNAETPAGNDEFVRKTEFEDIKTDLVYKTDFDGLKKEINKLKSEIKKLKGVENE